MATPDQKPNRIQFSDQRVILIRKPLRVPQFEPRSAELPKLAKPGIPLENPQRREEPYVPDPMPRRLPTPAEPVKIPQEPVPVRR